MPYQGKEQISLALEEADKITGVGEERQYMHPKVICPCNTNSTEH